MVRAKLSPIGFDYLEQVGTFLHANLNSGLSAEAWSAAARGSGADSAPNHGFMLTDGSAIVGVYLAFYSTRQIQEQTQRYCNLAAWCVLPSHRIHSFSLLRALLAQPGYHFLDLSPSGNTVPLNERLRFRYLDTRTLAIANVPRATFRSNCKVTSRSLDFTHMLDDKELRIYRDHVQAAAAHHVAIIDGDEHCYLIFRRDRRKGLRLFASILYVSNRALFSRSLARLGHHLLLHHGIPVTLIEQRFVEEHVRGAWIVPRPRPKMFKSDFLEESDIDYLYSELMYVPW